MQMQMQSTQGAPVGGKQHRHVIGPLVKTQTLFLNSGNTQLGTDNHTHFDFNTQLNGLIKCSSDEVMRVALVSCNVFNSYRQINETNKTITLRFADGVSINVEISEGNYPYIRLAAHLQNQLSAIVEGTTCYYDPIKNAFAIRWGGAALVQMEMRGGLHVVLGFRAAVLPPALRHDSDRAAQPHTLTDIALNVYGVSAIMQSHPIDNYSSPFDDCDVGHVLAVFSPPGPLERKEFVAQLPESHAMYIAEKSVNTLRIRLTDSNGQPLTWVNNQVGVVLQFSTYKRD
jgi:hypothetical protein